jgi:hypothetical protein
MQFNREEQWGYDLDWFAVDRKDRLARFTTNGRPLPECVAISKEDWQKTLDYFYGLSAEPDCAAMSPEVPNIVQWRDERAKERYLKDFLNMAARGLYSYDLYDLAKRPRSYIRVAVPKRPRMLSDLPPDIRAIVEQTRLDSICFADTVEIPEHQQ